eukprot:g3704.t1
MDFYDSDYSSCDDVDLSLESANKTKGKDRGKIRITSTTITHHSPRIRRKPPKLPARNKTKAVPPKLPRKGGTTLNDAFSLLSASLAGHEEVASALKDHRRDSIGSTASSSNTAPPGILHCETVYKKKECTPVENLMNCLKEAKFLPEMTEFEKLPSEIKRVVRATVQEAESFLWSSSSSSPLLQKTKTAKKPSQKKTKIMKKTVQKPRKIETNLSETPIAEAIGNGMGASSTNREGEQLSRRFSLHDLQTMRRTNSLHNTMKPHCLEEYMLDEEFEKHFSMTREKWKTLPDWKKHRFKKEKKIF